MILGGKTSSPSPHYQVLSLFKETLLTIACAVIEPTKIYQ